MLELDGNVVDDMIDVLKRFAHFHGFDITKGEKACRDVDSGYIRGQLELIRWNINC